MLTDCMRQGGLGCCNNILSLVDNAELVFATLSATGRRVLQQGLSRGFETVGEGDKSVRLRLRPSAAGRG